MKAKISIILSDDSCRELFTNFGLESAEELKTMLKICFGNVTSELSGGDEIKVEVEE